MTEWAGFWIASALLIIMLSGEPDIKDAIVSKLTGIPIEDLVHGVEIR